MYRAAMTDYLSDVLKAKTFSAASSTGRLLDAREGTNRHTTIMSGERLP